MTEQLLQQLTKELTEQLSGGRIAKIAQPETDELLFTIKTPQGQKRLYISASASLPLIYLTNVNKPSPMNAPNFCMLLRKHIGNGRITRITQPGLERIIQIQIEHLDDLGDLCRKTLVVEIMGKHSNIIFCDAVRTDHRQYQAHLRTDEFCTVKYCRADRILFRIQWVKKTL